MKLSPAYLKIAFAFIAFGFVSACNNDSKNKATQLAVHTPQEVVLVAPAVQSVKGYSIGDTATDFKLKDVNGKMVSLSSYKDAKGYIVVFTCNTCPFAVASEDRLVALDKEFKTKGYPVIAINPNNPKVQPDDTFELMQQKAKEAGFTFPYLYDEKQEIYAVYGATKTPHVYLLQKENGKNVVKYIGAIDDNVRDAAAVKDRFLANAVNELLAGKEVTVKETKAIGCSVKQ